MEEIKGYNKVEQMQERFDHESNPNALCDDPNCLFHPRKT